MRSLLFLCVVSCFFVSISEQSAIFNVREVDESTQSSNVLASADPKKCIICRSIVQYVYDYVKEDRTQETIEGALDSVCSIFLYKDTERQCRQMIQHDAEKLVHLLVTWTEPELVCVILGYCIAAPQTVVVTDEECGLCKLVVSYVITELKDNKTEKAIQDELDKVCEEILPKKDVPSCETFVSQYTKELIDIILQETDPSSACISLGLCPNGEVVPFTAIEQTAVLVEAPKPNCAICKMVLDWVYKQLKEDRTEADIIAALDGVCDALLPQADRAKCESWVQQYTEQIINVITTEVDPDLACMMLGMCSVKEQQVVDKPKVDEEEANTSICSTNVATSNGSGICDLCKDLFAYVHAQVTSESTRQQAENVLDKACQILFPGKCPEQPKCAAFVKDNLSTILDLLAKDTQPNYACVTLGLCQSSQSGLEHDEAEEKSTNYLDHDDRVACLNNGIKQSAGDGRLCDICRMLFARFEDLLIDPRPKSEIIKDLDLVCRVLFPGGCPEKWRCITFVHEKTDAIFSALENATRPDEVCKSLHVCKFGPEIKNQEVCYGCQLIAHYIQEKLYDYKTETELNRFIEHELCERFKKTEFAESCNALIRQYGVLMEQMIAQRVFDPYTLCDKDLKLCSNSSRTKPNLEIELLKPEKQAVCQMCKKVVKAMDNALESDVIEKDLSSLAGKVCVSFPGGEQSKCIELIQVFGPYFFKMIGRVSDPSAVCKSIDLCYDAPHTHLLGARKCTYGPSYWCHTSAHADACQATDYCTKNIWHPIAN